MFDGGKEPRLSSSPAAVLSGQEMLFWLPRAHHSGGLPSPNPSPALCFFHLSPFSSAAQDEAAFCSLNLKKPNALETVVCQNNIALFIYLREVISTGSGRKDLLNILGTEKEVYEPRDLSSWFNLCSHFCYFLSPVVRHPSDAGAPFQTGKSILASSEGDYFVL